eukprot:752806-Hanusia_phi.AAC.3
MSKRLNRGIGVHFEAILPTDEEYKALKGMVFTTKSRGGVVTNEGGILPDRRSGSVETRGSINGTQERRGGGGAGREEREGKKLREGERAQGKRIGTHHTFVRRVEPCSRGEEERRGEER